MEARTNVYVFGPEDAAIDACVVLKNKGYDAHMGARRALGKMRYVREAAVVLRVGEDGDDDHTEAYARERHKPVYRSVPQLCAEVKPMKDQPKSNKADTYAPRRRKNKR